MQPRAGQLGRGWSKARLGLQTEFSDPLQTCTSGQTRLAGGLAAAGLGTNMGVHSQHKDGQDLNMDIKH